MRDRELYATILGLTTPWSVERVEVDLKGNAVHVWLSRVEGSSVECPECREPRPVYDHRQREWRHLDTCQLQTRLHARVPRVECPTHGVVQAAVPWATPGSQFTALFERLAIDWLQTAPISAVARRLGLRWDATWGIMRRAVRRGLARRQALVLRRVGVDEKSFQRRHQFVTVVSDLESPRVLYVADDRRRESLESFWAMGLTNAQRTGIEAIAMDMWEPYVQSVRGHVPRGEERVVFDRFHVMGHMNEAVDMVRRRENEELRETGESTLTGTKHLWLYARENLPARHEERFAELRRADLKTARAWGLKENLRRLWEFMHPSSAWRHWREWFGWAIRSKLAPVLQVARMIRSHLRGVMNFYDHPVTNAVSEGLNSKIQKFKQVACGFRNFDHFRTAIFFHCGGLRLYPVTHAIPG